MLHVSAVEKWQSIAAVTLNKYRELFFKANKKPPAVAGGFLYEKVLLPVDDDALCLFSAVGYYIYEVHAAIERLQGNSRIELVAQVCVVFLNNGLA